MEETVTEEGKAAAQSTRSGRILIVDDDEAIGSLLSRLLGEQHEVETTTMDGKLWSSFLRENMMSS